MKFIKKFFKWLFILLLVSCLALHLLGYGYLFKAVKTIYFNGHTTAFLSDYKYFDNAEIDNGSAQPWPIHQNYNTAKTTELLEETNTELGTIAYLIIKNDSIWFEKYYEDYNENSKSNSFSMAKSYVSGMLGKAIMDGYIKNLEQPVGDFIPEFSEGKAAKLTVGDLSSMASGTNWDEAYYSPFSVTTQAYFDDDLEDVILNLKVVNEPGTFYKYASGDTEMLAMVIERATGKKLYNYLSESFWKPMGCENQALWQVDSEEGDLVKAYCCIASNARDFARFGKLYKDHGKWNGKQLLDSTFIATSLKPRFNDSPFYGYGWWLHKKAGKNFFMMRGHLGQYVIVEPDDNVIIVRLGHQKSPDAGIGVYTKDIDIYIDEAYKMMTNATPN
ncbi:CubicO group peptidase, beta-lactamase class C family [Pustulibacterium marinum]|uniref:CubicO group peptidase, beta-lactamase class C family n=1 Tax=Pustulibacterium marinum TaxID=1224947 RepID=A0A1I7ET46_9FLAO|nr:serine hydrolase [Pustulibacterium marinum]SFU27090.1 CubicO group peptidase, beta-lactamase class C family [Pustulibacterium marinum]